MKRRAARSLHWLMTLFALVGIVSACARIVPPAPPQEARQALIDFFAHLAGREYEQAVELYGGDYAQLEDYGPGLDPADRASLWQNACEKSGLQCLPVYSAAFTGATGDVFRFNVKFRNPDGNVFALAPCCGEPGFMDAPQAEFVFRVQRTPSGAFLVLDLPVYVP